MVKASRVIGKASEFIGVHDTPLGSKNIIFNDVFYGEHRKLNWNIPFIWYLFRICDASALFFDGGTPNSIEELKQFYEKKGQIVEKANIGDLIIFKSGYVGIITRVIDDFYDYIIADMLDSSEVQMRSSTYTIELKDWENYLVDCFIRPSYFPENPPEKKGGDKIIKVKPNKK